MNPSVIQFACSHCQSELTVPAHLAGVAGPCPKCGHHIVSPNASVSPPPAPEPLPPVQQQQPTWAPAPELRETASMWRTPPTPREVPVEAPPSSPPPMMPPQGSPWPDLKPPAAPNPAWQQTPPPAYNQPAPGWGAPPATPPMTGYEAPMTAHPVAGAPPYQRPPTQPLQPMHGMPAMRPPTQPMMGQPSYSHPGTGPLDHNPQTSPSVGMQPTLLRSFDSPHVNQGPAAAPPMQPPSPAEAAMMQMRQTIPGADTAAQVSRPMTIGGSRLSLLARQLTASPQGPGGLPEAPDPLANDDLPGADAPRAVPMPDALRHQAAAQKMLHSQINRGRGVNMGGRSSGRFLRFAMSALFLLTAAGIAVYVMRDSLGLTKHFVEVEPVEPRTSEPSSGRAPEPGIDPVTDDAPAPVEEKPQPPKPRVVYAPPQAPVVKPAPAAPTVVVPRAVVSPEPEESPAAKIAGQKPATRAMPVDDEPPAPKAIPVENEPSERTAVVTQKPEAPKSDDRALVEVGRTKDEPKILAGNNASMKVVNSDNLDKPLVKNVPPKCQAALQGLKSFLAARSLKERLPYMQLASQIERKAAIYYTSNPDGPVEVDEIHYLRHDESPQVGRGMHAVFVLFNRSWDYGIPVMVEQTGDGVRVDWLSFIEFKDDLLHKFLTNYMDGPVRFHVGIRRTHYFEDDIPGIENKDTFEVTPPMENVHGFVFVPRGSALQRSLAGTISWDKEMSWVIVELQWRREGTAKWIEMTALPQLNWYSAGDEEATDAASASSPPVRK